MCEIEEEWQRGVEGLLCVIQCSVVYPVCVCICVFLCVCSCVCVCVCLKRKSNVIVSGPLCG